MCIVKKDVGKGSLSNMMERRKMARVGGTPDGGQKRGKGTQEVG